MEALQKFQLISGQHRFLAALNVELEGTPGSTGLGMIMIFIDGSDAAMKGLHHVIKYRRRIQKHIDCAYEPDKDHTQGLEGDGH